MKPARTSSPRIWLWAVVVVMVCFAGTLWFARRSKSAPVPAVDASRLEPSARQILEARIAEVRSRGKSAEAWGELGSVLRAFDLPREAAECFAEAERLDPANPRWPYFQAMLSLSE